MTSLTTNAESKDLMKRESENLLSEIDRLEKRRAMLSNRLKNVMDLAFATVNIDDNSQTRKLTEATVRDSAAMKQVIPRGTCSGNAGHEGGRVGGPSEVLIGVTLGGVKMAPGGFRQQS